MSNTTFRLHAYADETHYNVGRYRGIALVSMREEEALAYKAKITRILADSEVSELKWHELNSARMRFAAQKVLALILDGASRSALRADVLLWDIQDERHLIRGRDDIANLQRMYYHLLKNVLGKRPARHRLPRPAAF